MACEKHTDMKDQVMGSDQRLAAKEHLVTLMQAGSSWQEAAAQVGVQVGRSTAYRWLHQVRTRGKSTRLLTEAARFEGFIGGVAVWHAKSQFMGDRVWVSWWCKGHGRLVLGGAAASDQQ